MYAFGDAVYHGSAQGVPAQDPIVGMVATPNVDPVNETVSRMQAVQQYRASVAALEANNQMHKTALKMLG